jgi:bZIP transcription factor
MSPNATWQFLTNFRVSLKGCFNVEELTPSAWIIIALINWFAVCNSDTKRAPRVLAFLLCAQGIAAAGGGGGGPHERSSPFLFVEDRFDMSSAALSNTNRPSSSNSATALDCLGALLLPEDNDDAVLGVGESSTVTTAAANGTATVFGPTAVLKSPPIAPAEARKRRKAIITSQRQSGGIAVAASAAAAVAVAGGSSSTASTGSVDALLYLGENDLTTERLTTDSLLEVDADHGGAILPTIPSPTAAAATTTMDAPCVEAAAACAAALAEHDDDGTSAPLPVPLPTTEETPHTPMDVALPLPPSPLPAGAVAAGKRKASATAAAAADLDESSYHEEDDQAALDLDNHASQESAAAAAAAHANNKRAQIRYDPAIPMDKEQLAAWRREARRVRNRESAAASRQRIRGRIAELEDEVHDWKSKYITALSQLQSLEQERGLVVTTSTAATATTTMGQSDRAASQSKDDNGE